MTIIQQFSTRNAWTVQESSLGLILEALALKLYLVLVQSTAETNLPDSVVTVITIDVEVVVYSLYSHIFQDCLFLQQFGLQRGDILRCDCNLCQQKSYGLVASLLHTFQARNSRALENFPMVRTPTCSTVVRAPNKMESPSRWLDPLRVIISLYRSLHGGDHLQTSAPASIRRRRLRLKTTNAAVQNVAPISIAFAHKLF